jgi:hypothetical protein
VAVEGEVCSVTPWLRTGFQRFRSMFGDVDREQGTRGGGWTSHAYQERSKCGPQWPFIVHLENVYRLFRNYIKASPTQIADTCWIEHIYEFDLIQVSYFFFLLNSVATLCAVPTEHKMSHVRRGFYLGIGAPMSGSRCHSLRLKLEEL